LATEDAGTVAESVPSEFSVVTNGVPLTLIEDEDRKPLPETVSTKSDVPAMTEPGEIAVIIGTGLVTTSSAVALVPPPGAGLVTVMDTVPG
jgi:hypothetical protein